MATSPAAATTDPTAAPPESPPGGAPLPPMPTSENPAPDDATPANIPRSAAATAVRTVLLALIFAVSFELAARVEDLVRYGTPLFSRFTSQEDLTVRDALGMHGRPNARFQKWVLNDLGMRGPEPRGGAAKPPGTVRVVTVGASETFGLYESPDKEYPRQLEDSLRAALAPAGGAPASCVQVLNAALLGMSLPTVAQDVTMRLAALHPDLIVVYPTSVQYLDEAAPRAARPDSSGRSTDLSPRRALYPRSLTRLRNQLKLVLPEFVQTWLRRRDIERQVRGNPPGWRFTSVPPDRLAQYERDLRATIGAIHGAGAEPVLLTHANAFMKPGPRDAAKLYQWARFYPRAEGEVIVAFDSVAREVTTAVARDSGVTVVDVAGALYGGGDRVFADFSHFTDYGAARVASVLSTALAPEVRRRGACSSSPAASPAAAAPR
ncbi:MAG TPA: SGNH/GDSL hydrolase family protein [Gemmatimonadaceae bacterium]|nr:SGNH/GDSL hydrolase family protein [Gemmatimonadaceae bacterium]